MLRNIGTITAREEGPVRLVASDAEDLTGFLYFSVLFMCLLAGMVRAPPRIRIPRSGEGAVVLPGAAPCEDTLFIAAARGMPDSRVW